MVLGRRGAGLGGWCRAPHVHRRQKCSQQAWGLASGAFRDALGRALHPPCVPRDLGSGLKPEPCNALGASVTDTPYCTVRGRCRRPAARKTTGKPWIRPGPKGVATAAAPRNGTPRQTGAQPAQRCQCARARHRLAHSMRLRALRWHLAPARLGISDPSLEMLTTDLS